MEYAAIDYRDPDYAQRSYDEWVEAHGEPHNYRRADDGELLQMQMRLDAANEV
jgi:hypothetical protein